MHEGSQECIPRLLHLKVSTGWLLFSTRGYCLVEWLSPPRFYLEIPVTASSSALSGLGVLIAPPAYSSALYPTASP
jgi:hypothetical protein